MPLILGKVLYFSKPEAWGIGILKGFPDSKPSVFRWLLGGKGRYNVPRNHLNKKRFPMRFLHINCHIDCCLPVSHLGHVSISLASSLVELLEGCPVAEKSRKQARNQTWKIKVSTLFIMRISECPAMPTPRNKGNSGLVSSRCGIWKENPLNSQAHLRLISVVKGIPQVPQHKKNGFKSKKIKKGKGFLF